MAWSIQYSSFAYGVNGDEYTVVIYEDTTAIDGTFDLEGCEIDWRRDTESYIPGIIPSQATFGFLVENNTQKTWIEGLINKGDKQLYVQITQNSAPYWYGWLLTDNITIEDSSMPFVVELTAVDGLKDLENVPFDADAGLSTVIESLALCLNETEVVYVFIGATSPYIISCVDWWENQMPARSALLDPLALIKIDLTAYYKRKLDQDGFGQYELNDNGEPIPLSCYEVLTDLCRTFNADLYMCGGAYHFENPFTKHQNNSFYRYTHKLNGTYSGTATNDVRLYMDKTQGAREAGGTDTYLPSAKSVTNTYLHLTGNSVYAFSQSTDWTTLQNIAVVEAGAGNFAEFQINIRVAWDYISGPVNGFYDMKWDMAVKIGSYYLNGSSDGSTPIYWSTTVGTFTLVWKTPFIGWGDGYYNIVFNITVPNFPANATMQLSIVFDNAYFTGTNYNAAVDFNQITYTITSLDTGIFSSGTGLESITYTSGLATPNSTVYSVDLGQVLLGDGPSPGTPGALYVWNGTAFVRPSGNWRRYDTGTAYPIGRIRSLEVHALCRKPVYMIEGGFFNRTGYSPVTIDNSIVYEGVKYVCSMGTHNLDTQTFTGEWWSIAPYQTTDITITDSESSKKQSGKQIAGVAIGQGSATAALQQAKFASQVITQLTDFITSGDTVTGMNVSTITKATLQANDVITLISIATGNSQEFTVDADQTDNATSISVTSDTADYDFQIGSYILFGGQLSSRMIKFKQEGTVGGLTVTSDRVGKFETSDDCVMIEGGSSGVMQLKRVYVDNLPTTDPADGVSLWVDANGFLKKASA